MKRMMRPTISPKMMLVPRRSSHRLAIKLCRDHTARPAKARSLPPSTNPPDATIANPKNYAIRIRVQVSAASGATIKNEVITFQADELLCSGDSGGIALC